MNLVTIRIIIDAASALEAGSPQGSFFMFDDRRLAGSRFQRTDHLHTAVSPGDRIIWLLSPIECEVYAALTAIDICNDLCQVSPRTFEGTSIVYWEGEVKQAVDDLPYGMTFEIGGAKVSMTTDCASRLIDAVS